MCVCVCVSVSRTHHGPWAAADQMDRRSAILLQRAAAPVKRLHVSPILGQISEEEGRAPAAQREHE